jgi:chaperone BCS1
MICFITTNYKNNLDNALIRPGRVDFIMTFEAANKEQIMNMYKSFTLSTDCDQHKTFYQKCQELNIPTITTSLLQQYLMKYIDEPIKAIENIDEIRKLYESCKVSNEASETGLFS